MERTGRTPGQRLTHVITVVLLIVLVACGGSDDAGEESTASTRDLSETGEAVESPSPSSATGIIEECRQPGEGSLTITGGEPATEPKKGVPIECTVTLDDPVGGEEQVMARLPNSLFARVTSGGNVRMRILKDDNVWTGPGMWARVQLASASPGEWEVQRVLAT
jgi:hypothetical protein